MSFHIKYKCEVYVKELLANSFISEVFGPHNPLIMNVAALNCGNMHRAPKLLVKLTHVIRYTKSGSKT